MSNGLDAETIALLRKEQKPVERMRRVPAPEGIPTLLGTPGLQVHEDPSLSDANPGYMFSKFSPVDAMFVKPGAGKDVVAHENEHLMARRQFAHPAYLNTVFDEMAGKKGDVLRNKFVQDASKVYPYLQEKYGLKSSYFQPEMLKYQGDVAPNLAYEQLADLAAIEATTGVDLTKDPYLRKNLFKNRETREIYNALTGLRQTRLDSKDLPPHTRQKEVGSNLLTDIKEALTPKSYSKKKGGLVDKPLPGGSKLI